MQATRAIIAFAVFRLVGKFVFGQYVGVLALATILAPTSQWGMSHVGVRAIARQQRFSETWAKVVSTTYFGGMVGSAVAVLLGLLLYETHPAAVVLIASTQMVSFGIAQAAGLMTEAHHRSDIGLRISLIGAFFRLIALGVFALAGRHDLITWSAMSFTAMLLWASFAAATVASELGGYNIVRWPSRADLRMGFGFVFVQTASSGQTDIDKVVLNAYELEADAGVYSQGFRVSELAVVPLIAVVRATYAEFFRRGENSIRGALAFARSLTIGAASYGIVAGVLLWFTAPLFAFILNEEEVADVIRWLSAIPFIKALQYFPGNVLTGSDHHHIRARLIAFTMITNLVGNLVLARQFGWRAAAGTTIVVELLFAVLLWGAVLWMARREPEPSAAAVSSEV